jgi:hypothetical protein
MISFIICTNGKKVELTKLLIQSIFNTAGQDADIHLGGIVNGFSDLADRVHLHDFTHEATNGYVGALRNKTIEQAPGNILVYCDDDVIYPQEWYHKFLEYNKSNDWQVMTNKIYLPNGGRYWDRAIVDNATHTMVDYNHDKTDHRLFFCATWFAIKRECFNSNKFDPELLYYGGYQDKNLPVAKWKTAEDLELSRRLYDNGYVIDFDQNNYVFHAAWNFTEVMRTTNPNYKNVCVLSNLLVNEEETALIIRRLTIKSMFDNEFKHLTAEPDRYGNNEEEFAHQYSIINLYNRLLNRIPHENELIAQDSRQKPINELEWEILNSGEYKRLKVNAISDRLRSIRR